MEQLRWVKPLSHCGTIIANYTGGDAGSFYGRHWEQAGWKEFKAKAGQVIIRG
ncbi:MAG: hypothetical protein ACM3SR_09975 [Ignavibacteriales bacterium]